ncbi:hypothetical protein CONCODRAFT_14194 [Conidiobolus coronatus NRRL 28638]|uniref:Uncharacterized protein n=1 Tax=Conidiobolus coronatus (strain ATCC 28846 / CBS 209.66 / NRRL 28638) TaxID=796925 RepID=A0A137NPH3_CONC2|nr:hypothetical protein CONCODRAFT_14194 [Conidiobolus coronatus NRRL 28638]|eukprot:KXN64631.1 hypothetical protein CONCODRAFT_14194 [Conidiobolus coronatus NRRL 28638]
MNVFKLIYLASAIICNSLDDYNIKPECTKDFLQKYVSPYTNSVAMTKTPVFIRVRNEYESWKRCINWTRSQKATFDVHRPGTCLFTNNQYYSPKLVSKVEEEEKVVYQMPVEIKNQHQIFVGLDASWYRRFTEISLFKTVDQLFVPLDTIWANGAERFVQFDFFDMYTIRALGLDDVFVSNDCGASPKLGLDKDKENCNIIGLQSLDKTLTIDKQCVQVVHALIELGEENVDAYKGCFTLNNNINLKPVKGMKCAHLRKKDPEGGCTSNSLFITDSVFTNCKSNSALQSLPDVTPDKVGKILLDIAETGVSFIPYAGQTSAFVIGALRNTKSWDDAIKAVSKDLFNTDKGKELKQKVKDRLIDSLKKLIKK